MTGSEEYRHVLKFDVGDAHVLLVNPVSGAIDIAPKHLLENPPAEARAILERRGYRLSDAERIESLRRLEAIHKEHSRHVPYWFYVLTTLNCNFSCPICYEKRVKTRAETDVAMIEKIFGAIGAYQQTAGIPRERVNVVLFGGEPLCVSDQTVIYRALELVADNGWRAVIVTNGSLVKQFAHEFSEFRHAISDFRVSLDGPQPVHDFRRPYLGGRGSFADVVRGIDWLLANGLPVKMQTILGRGNMPALEGLAMFVENRGWLADPRFQWRIEGSHDYANLDPEKDEVSEGLMVSELIRLWDGNPSLRGKLKFESFKYLGHLTNSFGWLGTYKTYWGPKFGFCEPQKGFHYVFSTDGRAYHCPRTINNPAFLVGGAASGWLPREKELKRQSIMDKADCLTCRLNTLCGGGCAVQRACYPNFDCRAHALTVISEFIRLMEKRIIERAAPDIIIAINETW